MSQDARRGIVCAGNWIVDIVNDIPRWPAPSDLVTIEGQTRGLGGGAANVALDLCAFEVDYPVIPVGGVGVDRLGDDVVEQVERRGMTTAHLQRLTGYPTAQTLVMNVPGDSRTFFYFPGANDHVTRASIELAALGRPRLFYLGYLNLMGELDRRRDDGRTEAGYCSNRPVRRDADLRRSGLGRFRDHRQTVFATLPAIDVLLLNELDGARHRLAVVGPDDTQGMEQAARALLEGGVGQAVIVHSASARCGWTPSGHASHPGACPGGSHRQPGGSGRCVRGRGPARPA
ncbi:carbohydrate kinase family protein [Salinicola tamaricis]|uniref:carbohydrate kinase family protein n=1 Tax=Salinicola tamaricis TaxID=1771309 RepID=UPI000D0A742A|nr:carbohydrate kinase family protein [Salinicola tamaricis]